MRRYHVAALAGLDLHVGLSALLDITLPSLASASGGILVVEEGTAELLTFCLAGEWRTERQWLNEILSKRLKAGGDIENGDESVVCKSICARDGIHVYLCVPTDDHQKPCSDIKEIVNLRRRCDLLLECSRLSATTGKAGCEVAFLGLSSQFQMLHDRVRRVAVLDRAPVLITGERGSGKEAVARAIHYFSPRKDQPFAAINAAVLNDELFAADLFGFRKGSFTGALNDRKGVLQVLDGGTLFLDEITAAPVGVFAGLLRMLDYGEIQKIGEDIPIRVDVRIVTATNRDIEKMVADGSFPVDLYDRLNVLPVRVPPLREREGDISLLANYFLRVFCPRRGKCEKNWSCQCCLGADLTRDLCSYAWPGNVRELRNSILRLIAEDDERPFRAVTVFPAAPNHEKASESLDSAIRSFIYLVLERSNWNRSAAARSLGLPLSTLISKMKRLDIVKGKSNTPIRR